MVRNVVLQEMDEQTIGYGVTWQLDIPLTARNQDDSDNDVNDEEHDELPDNVPTTVREHLKTIILNRNDLTSNAEDDFRGESCHTNSEELSPEEQERVERRRHLNKLAAQRCRDKKKQQAEQLSTEILELEAKNTQLHHTVRKLTREREDLMNLIRTHFDVFHGGIAGDVLGGTDREATGC